MGKGKSFNFAQTPAAQEITGAMQTVTEQPQSTAQPSFTRKNKVKKEDWTLTQCRLPNDLHARMRDFCYHEGISINEFLTVAVRETLDKI